MQMPETITITPRRFNLAFDGLETVFIRDNPVLSALFCALSAVFPPGERQFIDSVRYYQDQVTDPEMKKQVRAFIGQEAHHGNLHDVMNDKLQSLGWRIDLIQQQVDFLNRRVTKTHSPERQLAQTVALEHLTALFADFLMNTPEFLGSNPNEDLKTLLLWHAVEETEHKAVAYDLYQLTVGDDRIRTKEMTFILPFFVAHMMEATVLLLAKNKQLERKTGWVEAYKAMWGKEGVFTYVRDELKAYYKVDFHPWQSDNSSLANQWLDKLAL